MKHKLTRNIGLKLLSLVVAFMIWLVVVNIDDPTDSTLFREIKIQTANADSVAEIDKTFDFVSDDTVVIKVTERESVLKRLTRDSFTVIADMESLNEMNSVPLTVICSNPSVTLDEIEIVPSSVKVKLEQKKQSEFVVNISSSGLPAKGYEVGKTEVVQGKTVQIAGPESMIDRIGKVEATVAVSGITADKRLTGSLKLYDKNGDSMDMSRLQIKDSGGVLLSDNTVLVDVSLWEVLNDIPVEVKMSGVPADGYRVASVTTVPPTVNLVGTPEALARLNGKIVLKDTVSVDGAVESFTADLDMSETLSEIDELQLVSGTEPTVSVTVQIEKTGDRTLAMPLSNLEILNRPENMNLTFSPADQISISVHADDESEAQPISLDDIKAKIDLEICAQPGDYEIPVQIELPDGYSLVSEVILIVNATEPEKMEEEVQTDAGE